MTPPKPLTAEARIEALTDEVEHLRFLLEEMTALPPEWAEREHGLTPSEHALLARVVRSGGEPVPFGALAAAISFAARTMDPPCSRTVSVVACRVRKKLAASNSPIRIRTVWGVGYALGGEA